MKTPFYLLDRYVYPALKRQLVLTLYSKGLNISEISRRLGISKSLVSRYIRGERGSLIDVSKYEDIIYRINRLGDKIINERIELWDIEVELIKLSIYMMKKKYICNYHKLLEPEIDTTRCYICLKAFSTIRI